MNYEQHDIQWTSEKVSRIWDYYSSNQSYNNQYFGAQSGQFVAKLIQKKIGYQNLNRILDFSCGPGDIMEQSLKYLKEPQELYGIDFSENTVKVANNRFEGNPIFKNVTLATKLPSDFEDQYFNMVMATEVVEHLNDEELDGMLEECNRLLPSGGYIFISTPNDEDYDACKVLCPDCGCMFHRWQHLRTWTQHSLKQKIEEHGFSTNFVQPIAWASLLRKMAVVLKPLPKTGLVYIGQKK